jgi:hypothetical protein
VLPASGAAVTQVSCAAFLEQLRGAAARTGGRELAALAALLPAPGGHDEAGLRRELAALLTDNAALYGKHECRRLEERWRLTDPDLRGPIAAYRDYLASALPRTAPDLTGRR